MDCPFCNPNGIIIKESKHCYLVVNVNQSKGAEAFMVVTKRHVALVEDLTPEEQNDYAIFWLQSYIDLKKKFGREMGNMLLNEGQHAGQNVPHIHGHIFTRSKEDDIVNMVRPKRYLAAQGEIKGLCEKAQ